MKKGFVYLGIGVAMIVGAFGFFVYALFHPEGSFPFAYTLYAIYLVTMIAMFVLAIRCFKNK